MNGPDIRKYVSIIWVNLIKMSERQDGSIPYSSGKTASDIRPLTYTLDINGMISDGRLSLAISYCGKQYQRETMEACADLLKTACSKSSHIVMLKIKFT